MPKNWTLDELASLSAADLKQLASNASELGRQDVADLCLTVLNSRLKPKKAQSRTSVPRVRLQRSSSDRRLEADTARLLEGTATTLLGRYDLSKERAQSLSSGSKTFKPHGLVDRHGKAKVGGHQRSGQVLFDRYISYRLNDEIYALVGILPRDQNIRYEILGPQRLLTNFLGIKILRNYLEDPETGSLAEGGEPYETYVEAERRFNWLMEQVAPTHTR
jgi:hypothetical protein